MLQEQMANAEVRTKVFEMVDQQSTKSEAHLMQRKNLKSSQEQQKELFMMICFIKNINH